MCNLGEYLWKKAYVKGFAQGYAKTYAERCAKSYAEVSDKSYEELYDKLISAFRPCVREAEFIGWDILSFILDGSRFCLYLRSSCGHGVSCFLQFPC